MNSQTAYQHVYKALSKVSFLVKVKSFVNQTGLYVVVAKGKIIKVLRSLLGTKQQDSHHFAVVCVRRKVYVDLAIRAINSLHLHNPHHHVTIFYDQSISQYLQQQWSKLDYPNLVQEKQLQVSSTQPWQYAKLEAVITASKNNWILFDADSVWYADPVIDTNTVTLLVKAYDFAENHTESEVLRRLFPKQSFTGASHFVTGFVSIPAKFMTKRFEAKLHDCVEKIFAHNLSFISSVTERESIRRLAEEIGICVALHLEYPELAVKTLKQTDGPGNKQVLQSLYYGCANQIIH